MKIIVINGSGKTGKDKFVKFFDKNNRRSVLNISTVDHIKKAAKKYLDWDGKKDEAGRQLLVDIKQACIKYNDGPFNHVVNKIKNKNCEINFVHCREPEEIEKFKKHYGSDLITVLLRRDDREIPNNAADRGVHNYVYDYYIDNNGTETDLEKKVIELVNKIVNS